ncbi:MAG: NAD-dependent succinate-semialdehyde dehydrogenase [Alphaproteobacteria bacterium]|jgi:succinate-semialdehyde dehydrogenase / glutarate-semialdehyde dehydrogenase|nr:NAD-dependent succinate-semialdehyde dehydrogenase [Rhodospirillaceae bacterium]MBT6510505.1 NAD-dependent succinate-semialdehyde dehydrogenase [Rhodospirillaceae bacterium]MDG2481860.1 NAD-dependent succinate-semialdehyde dehydrogenase [Alphaproteobacteria bacterium]
MFIDGAWQTAERMFDVLNPADGAVLEQVGDGGAEDAERAVEAAHAAFPAWAGTTAYERSAILMKAHRLMLERRDELARTMTLEQGKPLRAATMEVGYGADFLSWFAEEAKRVEGRTIPSARRDQRFLAIRQPVGVVAAIIPWNYPVSMITRKLAPALAAGCTAVLKPAEATPLTAIAMMKLFEAAGVPKGVVNLVTCSDPAPVGEVLVSHPKVRKLTFTGSTAVGKMLAGKAASHMKRVSCELGGHAPFLVFEDADPVHAAKGVQLVKFLNTGQACISPNRIFVHRSNLEPFIATLTERVGRMKAGNGLEEGVSIGPLVNDEAMQKMVRQVADARDKGAGVACGGERLTSGGLDKGFFFAPTVLTDVTPEMLIYREETFGPIAPIIPFDDEGEAIAMANDTDYGLAAYIYTRDIARAFRAFEALDFGIIGINDINPTSAAAPFGGMKDSGLGREGSHEGIDEYLETKLGGFAI